MTTCQAPNSPCSLPLGVPWCARRVPAHRAGYCGPHVIQAPAAQGKALRWSRHTDQGAEAPWVGPESARLQHGVRCGEVAAQEARVRLGDLDEQLDYTSQARLP